MFPHRNILNTPRSNLMGRVTIRSITYWYKEDGMLVYSAYNLSRGLTVLLIITWWLQKLGKGCR